LQPQTTTPDTGDTTTSCATTRPSLGSPGVPLCGSTWQSWWVCLPVSTVQRAVAEVVAMVTAVTVVVVTVVVVVTLVVMATRMLCCGTGFSVPSASLRRRRGAAPGLLSRQQ
jgi:hypothetical protein